MELLLLFFLVLNVQTIQAFNFNQLSFENSKEPFNIYPDSCCQLEWKNITSGQRLPPDYVLAGDHLGQKWAYTVSRYPYVALKPQNQHQPPNWLCELDKYRIKDGPWPILVNPNKCVIGWYSTQYLKESKPENKNWFFPNPSWSEYGAFARRGNIPGRDGHFAYLKDDKFCHYDDYEKSTEMLYVDCSKSLLLMSNAELINITYDPNDMTKLLQSKTEVIYVTKTLHNQSPYMQENSIKFSIETSNNASVRFKNNVGKFSRMYKEDSSRWNVNSKVSVGVPKFFSWLVNVGVEVSGGYESQKKASSLFENSESSEGDMQVFTSKKDYFEFHQNVKMPPYSKTVVKAVSYPHKGPITFKAVYELTPSGTHTIGQVTAALTKYGFIENFSLTNHGTILVENEGSVDVKAGHNIEVFIDSHPLPGDHSEFKNIIPKSSRRIKLVPKKLDP